MLRLELEYKVVESECIVKSSYLQRPVRLHLQRRRQQGVAADEAVAVPHLLLEAGHQLGLRLAGGLARRQRGGHLAQQAPAGHHLEVPAVVLVQRGVLEKLVKAPATSPQILRTLSIAEEKGTPAGVGIQGAQGPALGSWEVQPPAACECDSVTGLPPGGLVLGLAVEEDGPQRPHTQLVQRRLSRGPPALRPEKLPPPVHLPQPPEQPPARRHLTHLVSRRPIRRRKRGYILMTDQSDRKHGFILAHLVCLAVPARIPSGLRQPPHSGRHALHRPELKGGRR
eukprot:1190908-Prorocentrum_minimum.AAC.1